MTVDQGTVSKTVGDVRYMSAVTPHHSNVIMTSKRAPIRDPHVRKLADSIIAALIGEIAEIRRSRVPVLSYVA